LEERLRSFPDLIHAGASSSVANHLAAIHSLAAHVAVQNALREVYSQPLVQAGVADRRLALVFPMLGLRLVS
jgi:hypothetical protein